MSLPANASNVIAAIKLKSASGQSLSSLAYNTAALSVFVRASNASSFTEYGPAGTAMVTATGGSYTSGGFIRTLTNAAAVVAEFHVPAIHVVPGQAIEIVVAYNSEEIGAWREVVNLPAVNTSGHVSRVTLVDTTTTNTDMRGTNNAMLAASYVAPDNAGIGSIGSALTSLAGKFTGITSLASWLKLALRKDFTDATASTEIGGTYSASTDSLEAQQESAGGGGASVEDIVAALSGITITYSGPVMPDRSIVLDAGDDYTAAGRKLTYTITGYTGASLDGEECELRFLPLSLWRTVGDETEGTVIATATISQSGTTLTIEFAIASSQTSDLGPATVKDGRVQYKAKVFVPSIEATLLRADATVYRSF